MNTKISWIISSPCRMFRELQWLSSNSYSLDPCYWSLVWLWKINTQLFVAMTSFSRLFFSDSKFLFHLVSCGKFSSCELLQRKCWKLNNRNETNFSIEFLSPIRLVAIDKIENFHFCFAGFKNFSLSLLKHFLFVCCFLENHRMSIHFSNNAQLSRINYTLHHTANG